MREKDGGKFAAAANYQLVQTGQFEIKKCPLKLKNLNPATKIKVGAVFVCFC